MATDPLTSAIEDGTPLVVLSPHLDDAMLSCGALVMHARSHVLVTVVTLFTEAGPPPYTLSARRCLRLHGFRDAAQLYASRRAEDRAILERLGVRWHHLGLAEGLFRRKPAERTRRGRPFRRLLPESTHVYPTYRHHLAAGRISRFDTSILTRMISVLQHDFGQEDNLLLAPLAVGGHVDHLLVRTAAELSGRRVGYYSDFPYNQYAGVDPAFCLRNNPQVCEWDRAIPDKVPLIKAYRTQAHLAFPSGRIPEVPETYLFPRSP